MILCMCVCMWVYAFVFARGRTDIESISEKGEVLLCEAIPSGNEEVGQETMDESHDTVPLHSDTVEADNCSPVKEGGN